MKKLVIVGTGSRGVASYLSTLPVEFNGELEILGIFDINPARAQAANQLAGTNVPVFTDFTAMMDAVRPDTVVVTSKDSTHAEYVIQALNRGCEAICEKPLCTTFEQVTGIREAAAASQANGWVTHNMRFVPDVTAVKQRIRDGTIGDVLHIKFCETLDRYHGADYFRRWHRFMENSAGLMVHKASHHFDVINWLAGALPKTVTAQGSLSFYGSNGPFRGERCSNCAHTHECEFYADVFSDERYRILYQEPEKVDGYFRDGCVFDPDIDIPDTIAATLTYENGVVVAYSLIAYASYESAHLAVEGTRGRVEMLHHYGTAWAVGRKQRIQGSMANDGDDPETGEQCTLYLANEDKVVDITSPPVVGGHGGSDPMLRRFLFGSKPVHDPLCLKAPLEEGIQAVLVALAANESIRRDGAPIDVQTLQPRP